jgi:hypothetical protein
MTVQTPTKGALPEGNVLFVDFGREPDPSAPKFPGAGAMHAPYEFNTTHPHGAWAMDRAA